MEVEVEAERHPIRFMVKFLIFAGILYAAGRLLAQQKDQWMGLTESQAREKMESKLGPRIGEDKASEIAEQVVAALAERGVIKPDVEDKTETPAEASEEESG